MGHGRSRPRTASGTIVAVTALSITPRRTTAAMLVVATIEHADPRQMTLDLDDDGDAIEHVAGDDDARAA